MIGITNAVSSIIGRITVRYPVGSTCTCSNGITTYTAPDTSGIATFNLREIGDWFLTCTNGSQTITENVSFTDWWQSETVNIGYVIKLIDGGTIVAPFTLSAGSLTSGDDYAAFESSGPYARIAYTPVNLTGYETLTISLSDNNVSLYGQNAPAIGISSSPPTIHPDNLTIDSYLAQKKLSENIVNFNSGIFNLDISDYDGQLYVFVTVSGNTGYEGILNITDFYVE